jgi:hypothetical protein
MKTYFAKKWLISQILRKKYILSNIRNPTWKDALK